MFESKESGSSSLFGLVLLGGILSVSAIMSNLQRVAMKAKESSLRMSAGNAFIANLSAISRLHSKLDFAGEAVPELVVVENAIKGKSSEHMTIRDGRAVFKQVNASETAAMLPEVFFGGKRFTDKRVATELQILQTKVKDDRIIYVVKAITKADEGTGENGIETLGTINIRKLDDESESTPPPVAIVPIPGPGPSTPSIPVITTPTCKGKSLFGHCYFMSAYNVSAIATCAEKKLVYDAVGTESLPESDDACNAVLDALGQPNPGPMKHTFPDGKYNGVGCKFFPSGDWMNGRWNESKANPTQGGGRRAVACK